jgi:uncharacterized sulfatase
MAGMTRRSFLKSSAAAAAAAALPRAAFAQDGGGTGLNVLLITAEDMRPILGCYGDPLAYTPNIDRLAARSVMFTNAHCQAPVCSPSRASFLTGTYPETNGVLSNDINHFRDKLPDVVTLPQHFRANGFYSARAGKIFHGTDRDPGSWDENAGTRPAKASSPYPEGRQRWNNELEIGTPEWREWYRKWSDRFGPDDLPDDHWSDYKTARRVEMVLRERREEPFFLAMGMHQVHSPLLAPPQYFDHYPLDRIELPESFRANAQAWEERSKLSRGWNFDIFIQRDAEPEEARRAIQAYYATVSHADDMIGRVLDVCDELDLWRDTVVVFMADHGFHLGERGLWAKLTLYEESTRVPFMIAAPGVAPGVSTEPVQLLDLYPTLCGLCGLEAPEILQGTSLVPALRDPGNPRDRAAYTMIGYRRVNGCTIRTDRYRYTEWRDGARELYDHGADPKEIHNLLWDDRPEPAVTPELTALLNEARTRAGGEGWDA